jgi:hypothetical protein
MAAALIAHATSVAAFIIVNRTTIRLVVATNPPRVSAISRALTLLRNIRRLFAVEISSQRMECWRQRLAHEFTLI